MEILRSGWRKKYIMEGKSSACIFCEKPKEDDKKAFILYRGAFSFVMLNLYPYNNGHIMISPYRHLSCFSALDKEELTEVSRLIQETITIIKNEMSPEGFNTGMNIGKASGAGFADHIHFHIVPRWGGDTNFMPVVGKTKVISIDLAATFDILLPHFKQLII